jgi:hypothetical protein
MTTHLSAATSVNNFMAGEIGLEPYPQHIYLGNY